MMLSGFFRTKKPTTEYLKLTVNFLNSFTEDDHWEIAYDTPYKVHLLTCKDIYIDRCNNWGMTNEAFAETYDISVEDFKIIQKYGELVHVRR